MSCRALCSLTRRAAATALLAGLAVTGLAEAPYVVLPTGQKVVGVSVRAAEDGSIALTAAQGVLMFPKGTRVVVDEPADYARALQFLQAKQFDRAVPVIEKVMREFRWLGWDVKAQALFARALLGQKEFKRAVANFEAVFSVDPTMKDDPELRERYVLALAGAGETAKLAPVLTETIATGPRELAAKALLMRGAANLAAGEVEDALLDFLCVAELFLDQKDLQAEALFRTAECLARLGDKRAVDYYTRVFKDYPSSTFAADARSRLP